MSYFKIALLQLRTTDSQSDNLKIGLGACRKAKDLGADLALFPEMWNIGYQYEKVLPQFSISMESDFIISFKKLANEINMAIAITCLSSGLKKPKNSLILINSRGEIIMNYSKIHVCTFSEVESGLESGDEFKVASLEFKDGVVQLGAMICFDREFPESARTLTSKGAEIIITANACLLHDDKLVGDVRLSQFRTRAFENMVGVAMCNYPDPFNGYSCAFDVDGKPLLTPEPQEGIYLAKFDLKKIREWRKTEIWGEKYSRPECYVAPTVKKY